MFTPAHFLPLSQRRKERYSVKQKTRAKKAVVLRAGSELQEAPPSTTARGRDVKGLGCGSCGCCCGAAWEWLGFSPRARGQAFQENWFPANGAWASDFFGMSKAAVPTIRSWVAPSLPCERLDTRGGWRAERAKSVDHHNREGGCRSYESVALWFSAIAFKGKGPRNIIAHDKRDDGHVIGKGQKGPHNRIEQRNSRRAR